MSAKVRKINYGRRFLKMQAEKKYGEGDYLSALRFAVRETELYGADADCFARFADVYENLGLYTSAINCWYRYVDVCDEIDVPDAYEGLAVNYMNSGNDAQAAYYYNMLIEADDTLSGGDKAQIAEMFAKEKTSGFKFVYPPRLADFKEELARGGFALKSGDVDGAIENFSAVKKGSKEYIPAMQMQAVAQLLKGDDEGAEETCADILAEQPNNVQALSTLSAIYAEEGRANESRAIAEKLCLMSGVTAEEKYKIATVACENGMHERAFELFTELEKEFPYDGNLIYFKGVAAAECGDYQTAENAFEKLVTLYPDAETGRYYLRGLRLFKADTANGLPPFSYFYKIPLDEREERADRMRKLLKLPMKEIAVAAEELLGEGIFHWAFDELDGMDRELQWFAVKCAGEGLRCGSEACGAFLRELALDCEVKDAIKIEVLRAFLQLGAPTELGVVVCNVYKRVTLPSVKFARKKRKTFLNAYADVASKFAVIGDAYLRRIRLTAEKAYGQFSEANLLDEVTSEEALSAAIYLCSDLRGEGDRLKEACVLFAASEEETKKLLALKERIDESDMYERVARVVRSKTKRILDELKEILDEDDESVEKTDENGVFDEIEKKEHTSEGEEESPEKV